MANIYDFRRYGKLLFLVATALVVLLFVHFSSRLIADLQQQEQQRMEIWAGATRELAASAMGENPDTNIDFLLGIIRQNTNIPVLLTDDAGNILDQRNFELPGGDDPADERNVRYLQSKLAELRETPRCIEIDIASDVTQYLYYDESTLLRRMSVFPYVQLLVMIAFVAVVYFAVLSTKKAEQNKVWIGLSKETAHQLGTPISSLMAWTELLRDLGVDADTIAEMNKDVARLSTVASRFSKIGSEPKMEPADAVAVVSEAVDYMGTRISPKIHLSLDKIAPEAHIMACAPLLEWVCENLIKNAVDAMEGSGSITVQLRATDNDVIVDFTDTGKGISRKNFKTVFNPGFTTKSRGWGLGLTLAKRIVEQYHHGHIFVVHSAIGVGTTFRITLPLSS